MTQRLPALFIPHGGGPWPLMDGDFLHSHDDLAAHLREIDTSIGRRPRAIAIVSAHWEEPVTTINASPAPPLLYDYDGFPEHTYRVRYDAPGSPVLAAHVRDLLTRAGIESALDSQRGYDHGVFVPLIVAYPDADVPIVQISLRSDMNAATQLAVGRALAPLRDEDVLVVGSGMSFHNMRAFFDRTPQMRDAASAFDRWLVETLSIRDEARRDAELARWQEAPGARIAHPTPEHFLPLFVAAGAAAGDRATRTFARELLGYPVSGFRFG